MKAKDLLRGLALKKEPEDMLPELTDAQLTTAVQTVAQTFSMLKKEAERRDIWNKIVKKQ